mgnify:CR=1 FL=1
MGNVKKYGNGGSKPMKGYNMGGSTMGAGDGDMTPQKAGMNNPRVGMVDRFAKMGGTMGTTDVMDVYKKGGGTKKGMMRKTARRAYKK